MSFTIPTMRAILIAGLLNLPVTAQEQLHNSELIASIEEQIDGQVWLRKSETDGVLVTHARIGSIAPKGSLQVLKQLPPVTELEASIAPEETELLREFHELRRLRISISGIDEEPPLPVLPNLEYLEISPSAEGVRPLMESVSQLPHLRYLTIDGSGQDVSYGVKDKDLVWLRNAPLETLRTTNGLGLDSPEHIAQIKTLRTLIFEHANFKPGNLEVLNQLTHLTTLVIPGHDLDDSHFESLSTLPAIQRLIIDSDFGSVLTVERIRALSNIPTLQLIESRFGAYPPEQMEAFRKLIPTARFVFYGPTENPLDELKGAVIEPFRIVEEQYLGSDPTKFSHQKHFHDRLILERSKPVNGELAEKVRAILIDPETYNMSGGAGCFVPGLGLRFTKGEKTCDVLVCLLCFQVVFETPQNHLLDETQWLEKNGGGSISDDARLKLLNVYREIFGEPKEGGIYLRSLPKDDSETHLEHLKDFVEGFIETDNPETEKWAPLVSLNLTECQISGAHLKVISPLRKLQELHLNGTPVGDAELEILKAYDFLKVLDLSGTNVTPSGVESLRQSLPDTKVIYQAN